MTHPENHSKHHNEPEAQLYQQLERLRQLQPSAPAHLAPRILANLPETTAFERVTVWLTTTLWRPTLAAAVPLLVGFFAGVFSGTPHLEDVTRWYAAEDLVYAATIEEYTYDEI